jgi:hypothetical protein
MDTRKIRGFPISTEEFIEVASKYDPKIKEEGGRHKKIQNSKTVVGEKTGIPWISFGCTKTDKNGKFKLVLSCWNVYGVSKANPEQEKLLSEMFNREIVDLEVEL